MAHQHHDHTDVDWAGMAPHLEAQAELFTPVYRQIGDWLRARGVRPELIVDAGSGPGVVSCVFAEAFPDARVVAVDDAQPLLERARARAARLGLTDRFTTLTAELPGALEELDRPADLLWASRSLHHIGDQRAALAAFASRLAPGGTLALQEGGLPLRCLPRDIGIGRPGLQARLNAVEEEWFMRMRAALPGTERVTEDWPGLLTSVGLGTPVSRTFLLDLPAPLSDEARAYVVSSFQHRRDLLGDLPDDSDRATLDRLLDPDDKVSLHHRPDVFVLAAYTLYTAVRQR